MLVLSEFPPNGRRVDYNFYYLFSDLWKGLIYTLEKYVKKQKLKIKDSKFYYTSNSIRETFAKIAALYTRKIIIVTFANPGVFDLAISESYSNSLSNRTIRVAQNKYDQVLVVTPSLFSCVQVEEQLRVPVDDVYRSLNKRYNSYYQTGSTIKEYDFYLDNSRSIFYPLNRGIILVNSTIFSSVQYYTVYSFLRCFSYQKIRPIGSCTEKGSKTVSYDVDSTLVKLSNLLSFIYINRQV